jgi:hypothetical protein
MIASGALTMIGLGCGGDDTSNQMDAQSDAVADQTVDASSDHIAADAVPDHTADAARDTSSENVVDAQSDLTSDAGSEAATTFDAQALYGFPDAVNAAYCGRLAYCCDGADASAFQFGGCVANLAPNGWLNVGLANVHSGNIEYNPTLAAQCLEDIASIPCGTDTASVFMAQILTCGQAMVGTLPIGSPGCTSAWDCEPPAYCNNFESDGGLAASGTCERLVQPGSPCHDLNYSTDCSELGNGDPSNYCGPSDGGEGGVCQPELGLGSPCQQYYQCQSQICDDTENVCLDSTVFSDPGVDGGACSYDNTPAEAGGP